MQEEDQFVKEMQSKQGLKEGWKEAKDNILNHQGLPCLPEIIQTKIINRHYNNFLADQFGIEKTQELITRKYYKPILKADIEFN